MGLQAWLLQGLAFPTISSLGYNEQPYLGPFFSAVESGLLDANMFALYLNPQQVGRLSVCLPGHPGKRTHFWS